MGTNLVQYWILGWSTQIWGFVYVLCEEMVKSGKILVRFQKIWEFDWVFFTFCTQNTMEGSLGKADVLKLFWIVMLWGKLKQGGEMPPKLNEFPWNHDFPQNKSLPAWKKEFLAQNLHLLPRELIGISSNSWLFKWFIPVNDDPTD